MLNEFGIDCKCPAETPNRFPDTLTDGHPHLNIRILTEQHHHMLNPNLFRSTESVIGLFVASVVYQPVLPEALWPRFGDLKNAAEVIHGIRDGLRLCGHSAASDAASGERLVHNGLEPLLLRWWLSHALS